MTLTIGPVISADDLEAVIAIEQASFTSPWTREMYLAELEHKGRAYIFLAKDDAGKAAGFCSCWRILDELHVNNLAVAPDFRRRGIGSALLQHVLVEGARAGAQRATLEVRRSNDVARLLYQRAGFEVRGLRPRYYTNPIEDALVLWKDDLSGS
ncbi:MAG: ribosomal protein S18-alanine N-acetyltransferase [Acidobacteria bacterium]|nr:ribosomal protein S18-alanine N-acetyltransferase [Acidobacteriota bacterium]